ncbi:XapX domain-containing protein [Rubritalea spongiae]|uniref:XapX domain-containing protein n=1 Tax=Rubritalea spongiae TaxID=430797 RepID=A0ABW5DZU1_9BACT
MQEILLATLTGLLVGVIFSALKLPIPAPPVLSGIMGIVGIFLGSQLYQWVINTFFS